MENNFKHQLLVAMPSLHNEFFTRAVIFIYEHTKDGTIGFVINKTLSANLGNVLNHLQIEIGDKKIIEHDIFSGGPVGPDQGFIIHDRLSLADSPDDTEVTISTSKEILSDIANGKAPDNFLIVLGYAGWEPLQLEEEIKNNSWLVVPFDKSILFEVPIAQRWKAAGNLIGIDMNKLSDQVGHG
jgi:putative transcriptional regulator